MMEPNVEEFQDENHWKLVKYGRYKNENDVPTQDRWQAIESDDIWMELEKSHHFVVYDGSTILENYSLWNASSWIRAARREDSVLFLLKVQNEDRRFRVKFADYGGRTGTEHCEAAVKVLSKYFSFKELGGGVQEGEQPPLECSGNASVGKLAQILSGDLKASLPLAYQQTQIPTCEMDLFVRLCLSDAHFPGFVEQVDEVLKKIVKEETDLNDI